MKWSRIWRQWFMMAGILLWIGILGPEIYVEQGTGCLTDENGRALTKEETEQLLEEWFYTEEKTESPSMRSYTEACWQSGWRRDRKV